MTSSAVSLGLGEMDRSIPPSSVAFGVLFRISSVIVCTLTSVFVCTVITEARLTDSFLARRISSDDRRGELEKSMSISEYCESSAFKNIEGIVGVSSLLILSSGEAGRTATGGGGSGLLEALPAKFKA
jgi:hypothetical protein